jgi:hypothetical protein
MTSKELVKKAIHFQRPERLPQYLPDDQENDLIWFWIKVPEDIQPWTVKGNVEQRIDCWGVLWERPCDAPEFGEAKKFPISNVTEFKGLEIPDYDRDDFYRHKIEKVAENNMSDNPKYCLSVLQFNNLFERCHSLIGLDRLMYEFYDHPAEFKEMLSVLTDNICKCVRREAEIGVDGVMMYDDWGLQDRLIVGKDLIREFFMPCYRRIWGLAHELGLDTFMHSCGQITEILPDFIDAGLDVIQMDQQENMGLKRLSREFGGKIAFWCPSDIQTVTAVGSAREVKDYVKKMVETLGSHNGGLISKYYPTPDACGHPQENTIAMCQAFREFGVYR